MTGVALAWMADAPMAMTEVAARQLTRAAASLRRRLRPGTRRGSPVGQPWHPP